MPINTPSSAHSEYFDAPVAIFHNNIDDSLPMSSQDIPPPIPRRSVQLKDNGPQPKPADTQIFNTFDTPPLRDPHMMAHPNESEGWLPAVDNAPNSPTFSAQAKPSSRKSSPVKRETSVSPNRENDPFASGSIAHRRGTMRTTGIASSPPSIHHGSMALSRSTSRKSNHTTSDGRIIPGSAFVNGAGATGPFALAAEDETLAARGAEANAHLTGKQKSKIAKVEAKHNRQLSKIIKQEAKTEKIALATAIFELGELQKYQKQAVKSESRVQVTHSKLLTTFKKTESTFLSAKAAYETALAQLNAEAENLETLRLSAREATEKLQDKAAEIDSLRATLSVDEREREVKLGQLKGRRTSLWK
ncbi:hypothetical protein CPB83DRAFT_150876 [Crepidotus variabilis]|uniref:Uncharacterized protein n=1 Tax=Crepidotus variabilis TaxID=179855 RepID=A0A9P6E3W4_9AGAR|nr:hypothetical protein CPB83DRAFT_150876 [Crepidotus variabilis]